MAPQQPPTSASPAARRRRTSSGPDGASGRPDGRSSADAGGWGVRSSVLWSQFVFLATGLISTLGAQGLFYKKAADARSLLTILTTYAGMALVAAVPRQRSVHAGLSEPAVSTPVAGSPQTNAFATPPTRTTFSPPSRWILLRPLSCISMHLQNCCAAAVASAQATLAAAVEPGINHRIVFGLSALDVVGNIALTVGMFLVGSGIYQVIYSSVIIFTAFFSRIFLGRILSSLQWLAVVTITFGLAFSAFGTTTTNNPTNNSNKPSREPSRESLQESSNEFAQAIAGFVVTMAGTAIYAGVYTLTDYFLTDAPVRISARVQCIWVGVYGTAIVLVLIATSGAVETISEMPLGDPGVAATYALLVLSALFHNLTYFDLIASTGAVATGVLQALRAVLVFVLSHVMFCSFDAAQCFQTAKGLAAVVVVAGVLAFAFANSPSSQSAPSIHADMADISPLKTTFGFNSNQSKSYIPLSNAAQPHNSKAIHLP